MTKYDSSIYRAILRTLTYSDHFDFPLTLEELHSRLISYPISRISLMRQIRLMVNKHAIAQTKKYYHLPGKSRLVSHRQSHEKTSQSKLALAHHYACLLARVPGVCALYLTGSLAVQNSSRDDDIDFMVITRPGALWLTRLLLTLYTELIGIRRRPSSSSNNNRLCLNLYLTPDSFTIPEAKRNLYTAYELIQAVPLFDPRHTRELLLSSNFWLLSYLPNYPIPEKLKSLKANKLPLIIRLFDSLAYRLQLFYMRGKMTREYVTRDSAFFHPADPGLTILYKLTSIPEKLIS